MNLESEKTDKWILECANYDRSYNDLMEVARKIDTFWSKEMDWINGKKFEYKHMMFHQVLDFNYFYRRTVSFVENYYKWLEE